MYHQKVKTQSQAVCHLFFHCCMKDGAFKEAELNQVSEKLVDLGIQKEVDVKEEVILYKEYRPMITDELAYLQHLKDLLNPANELALFSYCVELLLSDSLLEATEAKLAQNIAAKFDIDDATRETIIKLASQRRVVEVDKIF
jgi:uncharacterized tellurite resistance protein B-like protein